ncbi:MAG: DeoR family transcriptional regulator [Candidatus Sungbacteria bacterium]|nr:DeoR family transcriptional regulator [Candidatus Sungbacteria bacterium]
MFESRIPKEVQRRVFELTLALYRVTDFFPQGEVLRKHLREKGNEIFGGLGEYGFSGNYEHEAVAVLAKIQALKGYLNVARSMRFVKSINLTVLEREYDFLADFLHGELENTKPSVSPKAEPRGEEKVKESLSTWEEFSVSEEKKTGLEPISEAMNERQQKILEHLRKSEYAKISDFAPQFAGISTKTIQRDLQDLVTKNVLKKEGEKRWTIYSFNGHV